MFVYMKKVVIFVCVVFVGAGAAGTAAGAAAGGAAGGASGCDGGLREGLLMDPP